MASKHQASGDDGERDRAVDRLRAAVAERTRVGKPDEPAEGSQQQAEPSAPSSAVDDAASGRDAG